MYKPKKIIDLIDNAHITKKQFYTEIGLSQSGFEKMVSGNSFPRVDNLLLIAEYFGVSMDYFFERKNLTKVGMTDSFEMLLNKYTQAISENERLKMEVEKLKIELDEKFNTAGSLAATPKIPYKKG